MRVLLPEDDGNYYDARDLIPADLSGMLRTAQLTITNYHAFLARDAREIKGVSATTRKLLLAGKKDDPFRESEAAVVTRVLRDLGPGGGEVMVLNDEAHHCYQYRPATSALSADEREANEEAGVWFRGLQAVAKHVGVKAVHDLSATPFYLSGSGYSEGYIFPWTVSDFSLMDAIESGIVKVPRTPVDDDAPGELVTYLRLWDHVGDKLPKRASAKLAPGTWIPEPELEGALRSLYASYAKAFDHWQAELAPLGLTPPVFIVVCPNTVVSKLVFEWIAGVQLPATGPDGDEHAVARSGNLPLFSNYLDGQFAARPPTVLVDSAQLESGEALSADFKTAAEAEIALFKAEYRRRFPGADADKLTDADLLREVMNTVGKPGRLGEQVRCVVSVAMLTEGWDANTVTHILGIRAFRSQLLCEQVVGRGLRRRSYAVNAEGRFDPEYANVYGIPFAFIPSDKPPPPVTPAPPAIEVAALPGREGYRITFPKLDGYRLEIPDAPLWLDTAAATRFLIGPSTVPTRTEVDGIVGEGEVIRDDAWRTAREQQVAFALAKRLLDSHFAAGEDRRPWLFPQLVGIVRQWLAGCVDLADGYTVGALLRSAEGQAEAAEAIYAAVAHQEGNRRERMRPILRRFDPVGSTGDVRFLTRKATVATEKSEVSHVTLDGQGGNTWEQLLAAECELNPDVAAYVKNDHLGFTIPYVHKGRTHAYLPDFLLRLAQREGDVQRTLIVEVSGGRKSPGPTATKAATARDSWSAAVNNHGGFGRWGYLEVSTMVGVRETMAEAIANLYADRAIIGDPDLLDFHERSTRRGA